MSIPTWLSPLATNIQTDSRIEAHMAGDDYDDAAFQVEIARRVTEWSPVVMNRLRRVAMRSGLISSYDNDLSSVLSEDQQKTACLALTLLVISALWQNLPGSDSHIANQANSTGLSGGASPTVDRRLTSGEGLLAELEADIKTLAESAGANGLGAAGLAISTRPRRWDAYSRCR